MNKIINFIKYNNTFTIILTLILIGGGSAFASEEVRNNVIGQTITAVQGIDNTHVLNTDFTDFNLKFTINDVTEDDLSYQVSYTYDVVAIKDNVWQPLTKHKTFNVSKESLGEKDLGLYVSEELGELAQYELKYLKEVKEIEEQKGPQQQVAAIAYTGLKGLVLDPETKVLPGYTPVIAEEKEFEVYSEFTVSEVADSTVTDSGTDNTNTVTISDNNQIRVMNAADEDFIRQVVKEILAENRAVDSIADRNADSSADTTNDQPNQTNSTDTTVVDQTPEPVVNEPMIEETPVVEESAIEESAMEEVPVVEEPVIEPVTEEPVEEPVVEPAVEEPAVEEIPVVEELVEEPVVEETNQTTVDQTDTTDQTDETIVEEPVVEVVEEVVLEPAVEEPVIEDPVVEEPVTEE